MNNVRNVIASNIRSLRKRYGIAIEDMAKEIGIAKSTLSNYENEKSTPTVEILNLICNYFQINMGLFISEYYNEKIFPSTTSRFNNIVTLEEQFKVYTKYIGQYYVYHFKTGISQNTELNTGNLTIKEFKLQKNSSPVYKVEAVFGENKYEGDLLIFGRHAYISILGIHHFERILIILHDPPSSREYIGGLGVVSSVSQGRGKSPCVQKIMLSKLDIQDKEEEIRNILKLNNNYVIKIDELEDDTAYRIIGKR